MPFQSIDEIQFQCRHILTDGRRCKNPTLRAPKTAENPDGHENFCYFHHTTRRPIQNPRARRVARRSTFTLPLLEDRSSIQLAIGQVLQQIASNDIDPRRAGLLLYGLQIASLNLPKPNPKEEFEPTTVDEITHDPILGDLAPPAELGHDEPKSSIHLLLDHFDRIDSLQAVADPAPHLRTTPNSPPLKNLRKIQPEGGSTASAGSHGTRKYSPATLPHPIIGDRSSEHPGPACIHFLRTEVSYAQIHHRT